MIPELRPFSDTLSFVLMDFETAIKGFQQLNLQFSKSFRSQALHVSSERLLKSLEPGETPSSKTLFLRTNSLWTCFIFNDRLGYGCPEHTAQLSFHLSTETIHVGITHGQDDRVNGITFRLYYLHKRDSKTGEDRRSISLVSEGKWIFAQYGTPLQCEDTEKYKKEKTKQKLAPEDVLDLLEYKGIKIRDPGFVCLNEGVLIQRLQY